jgi:hypothetical protein
VWLSKEIGMQGQFSMDEVNLKSIKILVPPQTKLRAVINVTPKMCKSFGVNVWEFAHFYC